MAGTAFNAGSWLTSRHVLEGRGDAVAVHGEVPVTYRALAETVGVVAAALRSWGLRHDDRIVFITNDDLPMFTGILAAFTAGFVAVPISTMLSAGELGEIVADSGAVVVVASTEYRQKVEQAVAGAAELRHLICDGDEAMTAPAGVSTSTWADLLAAGRRQPAALREPAPTTDDSWALWLYTSGTTGSPKGAMHRHANIRHVCETYGAQVLGIRPDDVCFSIAKLFFAYGIGNSMFFPLAVGAGTVLESRRPSPAVVAERLTRNRPTLFFSVPTFYAALLASDLPAEVFGSVRLGTSAGEALPAALLHRFTDRFGVEIIDGIG